MVDELDYQLWQTGFGQAAINVELSSAVPEPAAVISAVLIAGCVIIGNRHRGRRHVTRCPARLGIAQPCLTKHLIQLARAVGEMIDRDIDCSKHAG